MTTLAKHRSMLVLLLLSGLIISICMGLRQSLGLFMRPMTLDAGISAATFGFAIALQNIVWGIAQPFAGALADKHGPRPILVVTALLYAGGLLLMALWHDAVGIDDTPAHHGQERDDAADLLDRHAEVVAAQHREIGELTDGECAARVLFEAEPCTALRVET